MKTEDFSIEGMTCGHCVMAVRKELEAIAGVEVRYVEIGRAGIVYDESVPREKIVHAVNEAGYRIAGQ
jgi:copper chaperone